jgi:site-specific DNA-methyltransferase (adenine-specific)
MSDGRKHSGPIRSKGSGYCQLERKASSKKDSRKDTPLSVHPELDDQSLSATKDYKLTFRETSIAYINKMGILFHADCLDVLSGIKDDSIDLVFADPPFNLGKDYDTTAYHDRMSAEAYKNWCRMWMSELVRVLRPGGSLTLYSWPRWIIEVGSQLHIIPELEYRSLISLKMKSGFPIKGRLHPSNYCILYYTKKGPKPTFNVVRYRTPVCRHCGKEIRDYGGYRHKFKRFEDDEGIPWVQISDFWEDTRPARHDKSRKSRINELPIHIPERIIQMASNKHDIVLDIFGGGGSTYQAAQMHDRFWIGCEIGNIDSCLSRFATIWGREEAKKPARLVSECFKPKYLRSLLMRRRQEKMLPIQNVVPLSNSDLIEKDMLSKSRVLGF